MKLIRHSTFETNSSSCHTISVAEGVQTYDGVYVNDLTNTVVIQPMEFGWNQDTFNDVDSKLSYAWIYINDWAGNRKDQFMEMFRKVVLEHSGAQEICAVKSNYDKYSPYGHIDHKSVEDGQLDFIFESEETLKNFLFSPESYIETDNDNNY